MLKKSLGSFAAVIFITGSLALCWVYRYNIYDYINLQGYIPPDAIAKLAVDDTMTDKGKNLFYVNKPLISNRDIFNSQCKNTEKTIVLGCYTGMNIYIFKVDDPKLHGVEQVTSAHEMLHVAYSRLSSAERAKIDKLVEVTYKKVSDPRIAALADSYRKQDSSSVPNELHSILGTEVRDLNPELEAYYARFFNNRKKVVGYSEAYEHVFEELRLQVQKYDADLALRKNEIEIKEKVLNDQSHQLVSQKTQMDAMLAQGNVSAYNVQVPLYNAAVNSYNTEIANVQKLIDEYNNLVAARNNLAVEQQNLAKSIDSRPTTIKN